jgi:hypothetical protein
VRGLHGVALAPTAIATIKGQLRRVWCNEDGAEVIEEYRIDDMGHGTPIDSSPANKGETAGPHMLDVGISSTRRLVGFWGLHRTDKPAQPAAPHPAPKYEEITLGMLRHAICQCMGRLAAPPRCRT